MKLLFDTHTFIWWANEPNKLSKKAITSCLDAANILILSVASVWEMQIKAQLGKLKLNIPLTDLVTIQQKANNIQILQIEMVHVLTIETLPQHHKDPFDRLLIAQAISEDAYIVSKDPMISKYSVKVLW